MTDYAGNTYHAPLVVCYYNPPGNGPNFAYNVRPLVPGSTDVCAAGYGAYVWVDGPNG